MKKECPNCAVDIPDAAETCPICRYDFPQRKALPWKPVAIVVLLVLAFPIFRALRRLIGQ